MAQYQIGKKGMRWSNNQVIQFKHSPEIIDENFRQDGSMAIVYETILHHFHTGFSVGGLPLTGDYSLISVIQDGMLELLTRLKTFVPSIEISEREQFEIPHPTIKAYLDKTDRIMLNIGYYPYGSQLSKNQWQPAVSQGLKEMIGLVNAYHNR